MNYIGSKFKLSSFLKNEIRKVVKGELRDKVFCDIFAGTGIVGRIFKKYVKRVISNDLEKYSFVLNRNYVGNSVEIAGKQKYIDRLNALKLKDDGFIYQHYCRGSGSGREYFSDENGKKIDVIREQIQIWYKNEEIDENLYYFLLASLIESADRVANTASVYGAHLKHLKKSANKKLRLEPAHFELDDRAHKIYNEDANELIKRIEGDILYLDPPYNQRQYGANYHILNTIVLNDDFIPKGKTGLRKYNKSNYSKKKIVHKNFEELIRNAKFKYIFLSYNNEGLMCKDSIEKIMSKYGDYNLVTIEYQRFKADNDKNRNHKTTSTDEYLHILIK